jgi:1,4-alpha-glucan branching enzyme
MLSKSAITALNNGQHRDPFAVLGPHREDGRRIIRAFQPNVKGLQLISALGDVMGAMQRIPDTDLFEAELPPRIRRYVFRATWEDGQTSDFEDPYRFPPMLGEMDLYLLGEGSDQRIYEKLGAHVTKTAGVPGTRFAVWAPNASRVSVVGEFNNWDGRCHVMRLHPGNGIWEIFIPAAASGMRYKFEITDSAGRLLPLKSDPYGKAHEPPPGNASVIFDSQYGWSDGSWMAGRDDVPRLDRPISIYEVHPGSWRRHEDGTYLGWRELAEQLVGYVSEMGFTHIELLPVTEHPFDGSWGYQPIGLFAPTYRFGSPDDFRFFVDACHAANIGVIVDWVPAHFPKDEHGLSHFDGTALYEHEDPRKGEHADWGTLIFNFGRREVINYLIGSALYWIHEFHIDAIRVDAVASMLYLDYSREDGEWLANEHGGNENLEAVEFIKRLNSEIHAAGATSYAEESTAWPGVSRPVDAGGLGFTYKWNMGWMNDTLDYMKEDPVHRRFHHDKMTFGLVYAFNENFVLPLSHDEVVHGKSSLLGRMPGDDWQQFANLRAYYATMFAHPGKKLLFMGAEIAQRREWDHDSSLDWHLLEHASHSGMQRLVADLNHLYKETPALFERDFDESGFQWLDWEDKENSVLAWRRIDHHGGDMLCITNLTPVVRHDYQVGVAAAGEYVELLNTDSEHYGGSNQGNGAVTATMSQYKGHPASLRLTLPPLATIYLGRR